MQQEILLTNQLSDLERLLDTAEVFLEQCGVPMPLQFKIKLALDEIFTNIVSYGYPQHQQDTVKVTLSVEDDMCTACLEDGGVAFDPLNEAKAPDTTLSADERPIGGLGIHLVKKLSQSINYKRLNERNILTFHISLI